MKIKTHAEFLLLPKRLPSFTIEFEDGGKTKVTRGCHVFVTPSDPNENEQDCDSRHWWFAKVLDIRGKANGKKFVYLSWYYDGFDGEKNINEWVGPKAQELLDGYREKYMDVLYAIGQTELIRTNHNGVVPVETIIDIADIKELQDKNLITKFPKVRPELDAVVSTDAEEDIAKHPKIEVNDYYYRVGLNVNSLAMTGVDWATCFVCKKFVELDEEIQRYCILCERWYHVENCTKSKGGEKLKGKLLRRWVPGDSERTRKLKLASVPIIRGKLATRKYDASKRPWEISGNYREVRMAHEWTRKKNWPGNYVEEIGEAYVTFVDKMKWSGYRVCRVCGNNRL